MNSASKLALRLLRARVVVAGPVRGLRRPPPPTLANWTGTVFNRRFATTPTPAPLKKLDPETAKPETAKPGKPEKQVSRHIGFYQDFGRPFAKVFLLAVVVYQAFYLFWTNMENMEFREDSEDRIKTLEKEVERLKALKGLE